MTVKAVDVAAYILRRKGPLEAMKLQKLVYYSQCHSLAVRGYALFPERIEAWKNGPVIPALYGHHRLQSYVHGPHIPGSTDALDDDDRQTVDAIIEKFSGFSAAELSKKTHEELPWNHARRGYPEGANSSAEITHESMRLYYVSAPDWAESNMHDRKTSPGPVSGTVRSTLTNILRKGLLQNMSRSAILDSVARQVASSQRLEGVEVTSSDVRRILNGRHGT